MGGIRGAELSRNQAIHLATALEQRPRVETLRNSGIPGAATDFARLPTGFSEAQRAKPD